MKPPKRLFPVLCCFMCVFGLPGLAQPEGSGYSERTGLQASEIKEDPPPVQLLKSTKVRILDPYHVSVPGVFDDLVQMTREWDPIGLGVNLVYIGEEPIPPADDPPRGMVLSGVVLPEGRTATREMSAYEILLTVLKAKGLTYRVERNILVVEEKQEKRNEAQASKALSPSPGLVEQKLMKIPVRQIHFRRAPLDLALDELVRISREMDPHGVGVNIVLFPPKQKNPKHSRGISRLPKAPDPFGSPSTPYHPPSRSSAEAMPEISLTLRGVSLYDALTFSVQKAGYQSRVQHNMIIVEPISNEKKKQEQAQEPAPRSPDIIAFENKLQSIPVRQINFRRAHISDVIEELIRISRENDPDKEGISMVFLDPELANPAQDQDISAPPIPDPFGGVTVLPPEPQHTSESLTMELRNVTLFEVWTLVMEMADLQYRIEDGRVLIGVGRH